jgi:hypothetical protein
MLTVPQMAMIPEASLMRAAPIKVRRAYRSASMSILSIVLYLYYNGNIQYR